MKINESEDMDAAITLKGDAGTDIVVAYLNAHNLRSDNMNFNGISINVTNQTLLTKNDAVNEAGETAAQQYNTFETAVKAKAKSLGYTIFG